MKQLSLLFLSLLIIGCTNPIRNTLNTSITETFYPTVIPSVTQEVTETPTSTMTETVVKILPSKTSLPPTVTPIPTLSPFAAQDRLFELLRENGGCQLPCWWGITPGETRMVDAQNLMRSLSSLAISISLYSGGYLDKILFSIPTRSDAKTNLYIIFSRDKFRVKNENMYKVQDIYVTLETVTKDDKVGFPDQSTTNKFPSLQLPQILEAYGPPDDIRVFTYQHVPWEVPMAIYLYYPKYGFSIEYTMKVISHDDKYVGCPLKSNIELLIVKPEKVGSVEEMFVGHLSTAVFENYLPIQQAANLSIEAFYDQFLNASDTTCLQTSKEVWYR